MSVFDVGIFYVIFLIAKGVDIITASNVLGHSRPSTTIDIYSHLLKKSKIKAMETLKDVLKEDESNAIKNA